MERGSLGDDCIRQMSAPARSTDPSRLDMATRHALGAQSPPSIHVMQQPGIIGGVQLANWTSGPRNLHASFRLILGLAEIPDPLPSDWTLATSVWSK